MNGFNVESESVVVESNSMLNQCSIQMLNLKELNRKKFEISRGLVPQPYDLVCPELNLRLSEKK